MERAKFTEFEKQIMQGTTLEKHFTNDVPESTKTGKAPHILKHLIIIFLVIVDSSVPILWVISTFYHLSPLFSLPCMLSIAAAFMYLFDPNRPHRAVKTVLRISFLLWVILTIGFVMWYITDLLCLYWDFASYAVRWDIGNWPLHFGPFETLYRLLKTS